MRIATSLIAFTLVLSSSMALAQPVRWTTYSIPQTGTSVDIPSSIFTELLDKPDGYGERLRSSDGRADLTVQSVPNSNGDSPEAYLKQKILPHASSTRGSGPISSLFRASRATRSGTTGATLPLRSSTAF